MRLQHLPFFALSSRFFQGLHSSFYRATMVYDNALTKALISIQHYTFLPMMLVARFGEGLALHALAAAAPLSWLCAERQDPQPLLGPESHLDRA